MTVTEKDLHRAAKEYYTALDKFKKAKAKWKVLIKEAGKEVVDAYYK